MTHNCNKCGVLLVVDENIPQSRVDQYRYICRKCYAEYSRNRQRDYSHRTGRKQPMNENRECPSFLGVHVAERVLSHIFKNVQKMPYNNPGFDFRCGNGYLVDSKCSCRYHRLHRAESWLFTIRKNRIAEYFLCLAFNNRNDLTPEHLWLIPAGDVNDHTTITITETRLDKWSKYEQPVDRVMACCNVLKGD